MSEEAWLPPRSFALWEMLRIMAAKVEGGFAKCNDNHLARATRTGA